MSKNSKIALWIVIVLVVVGIVWWAYAMHMKNNGSLQTNGYDQTTTLDSTTSTTVSSGNSNADLNQDMSKVDAQMTGLNSDSASAQSTNGNY